MKNMDLFIQRSKHIPANERLRSNVSCQKMNAKTINGMKYEIFGSPHTAQTRHTQPILI